MTKMGDELYKIAFRYDGDFDWFSKRAEVIKELSYAEFIKNAQQFLSRQNKQRFAVLLRGKIPASQEFRYTKARSSTWMCENSDYSSGSESKDADNNESP